MHPEVAPSNDTQPLKIVDIREEVPNVKTYFLQTKDITPLPYKAGQFLTFVFSRHGREERRSYSISSSPAAGEPLAITIKRVENGAHSRWLIDHARIGDELMGTAAAGVFTLPGNIEAYPQLFFFAAGIGITPILSLIKELLFSDTPTRIVLYYSNRSHTATAFKETLLRLQEQFSDRFKIEWLFSDAKNLLRARISKNNIRQLLHQYLEVAPGELLCYICGPEDYRWMLNLLLEEAGVPTYNIRKEIFVPGRMPVPSLPPDTEPHVVTILRGNEHYELKVQYPETILSAAKKAGIRMPYSCEAGRCASCIVQCTAGKVWMAYNEVLTENDLRHGLTLTCTGYPIGGDATLTIPS